MQPTNAIDGIILASFAFQESSYIISVLTREYGRIKCVTKSFKKSQMRSLCPLLGVELQVVLSDKELWKCRECLVATSYPNLRITLDTLKIAAKITDLLDKIIPLHHPVPHLYTLYTQFLENLPKFAKPHVAACTFLENFLVLEGMMEPESCILKNTLEGPYNADIDLGYLNNLLNMVVR